ncbi:MAG: dCTP deaminase [Candidatus Shapirobacteria bacterium]|jgi:dCTP deaminase
MSVLTRNEILDLLKKEKLKFAPELDQFQLQGHSIDLRLGYSFMVPRVWELVSEGRVALNIDRFKSDKKSFEIIELEEGQYFEILPGEHVIVSTLEKITLPTTVMGVLYPRSSVNRRGLSLDLTGIVDAGYEGTLVVPVRNTTGSQVIRVYPGERFCQIVLHPLMSEVKMEQSRWHNRDTTVEVLPERNTSEMDLLEKGDLRKLKQDFKLEF